SQTPAEERHSAVLFASAGHAALDPVQCSAGSHTPADDRHSVLDGAKSSAGHVVLEPVQCSATSQTSAAARHVAPAVPAGCWQAPLDPSHSSSEHGFPSAVQVVPPGCFASAGQLAPDPVQ